MKIVELEQPRKRMELYFVGDLHYPRGIRNKFLEVVMDIHNNKDGYMIGMGDWCEGITAGDPRYNPEEIARIVSEYSKSENGCASPLLNMIDEQWGMFEEDIKPLAKKKKILGLHSGNHGSSYSRRNSFNELRKICKRNDIEYLGDGMAIFKITHKDKAIFLQTFHGVGGGVTVGFAYKKLEDYSKILANVDIIASGHTHKLGVNISMSQLRLEGNELKQKTQYHCSCGSFLGNYDTETASYAERKAYPPLPIGYIKVVINKGIIEEVKPVPI